LSRRSTDVAAWVSHFGARKLRVDEAIAELERARRVFLKRRCAADQNELVEVGLGGEGEIIGQEHLPGAGYRDRRFIQSITWDESYGVKTPTSADAREPPKPTAVESSGPRYAADLHRRAARRADLLRR